MNKILVLLGLMAFTCIKLHAQITDQPATTAPTGSTSSSTQNVGSYQQQQPNPVIVPNAPGDPGPTPTVPIDGGISILIAAGVGYGVKKVKERRRKRLEELDKD